MKTATLLASITLCALCQLTAAPLGNDSVGRASRWQEDLDFFARELPVRQKDFSLLTFTNDFERSVAELKSKVPQLSDADIILQLMRIVAGLGVEHTYVDIESGTGAQALHDYPVKMQWFSDDLVVVAAKPEYRKALGNRVVRIGSRTPEQVEATLAPYISHENNIWLRVKSPACMELVELMHREEIADANGQLSLTCAQAGGGEFILELAPIVLAQTGQKWVTAASTLNIPSEFCHKRPKAFYWYEYLPDMHALYIQYSKCHNESGNSFADFTKNVFTFADSHPTQRVVVDLRFNSGGSSSVVKPLVDGLKLRPALSAGGHLYVLIGGQTFSSGVFAAMDFRNDLHAMLVGEPTGNKPNHYGQQESFVLPNSKLKVDYSVKHFHLMPDADPPSLKPDLVVSRSLEDFLAGRDRALDTALHHPLP